MATTHVSRVPHRTCMKKRMTSVALVAAIEQHDDVVERTHIDFRRGDGEDGADDQGGEHFVVHARRRDVRVPEGP